MAQNKNQNISYRETRGSNRTDRKEFDLNKYSSNSSKGCVPEIHL